MFSSTDRLHSYIPTHVHWQVPVYLFSASNVICVSVCQLLLCQYVMQLSIFFGTVTVSQVIFGVIFPLSNKNTAFSVLDYSVH